MRTDLFIDYLTDPGKLDTAAVLAFDEIIREYPFCQPAQLLYLKGLQNEENIRFNRQLKIAAAYATNRGILFELLNIPKTGSHESGVEPIDGIQPKEIEWVSDFKRETNEPDYERTGLVEQVEQFLPIADIDLLLFDFPAYNEDDLPEVPSQNRVPEFSGPTEIGILNDFDGLRTDNELLQQFLESDPLTKRRSIQPGIRSMGAARDEVPTENLIPKKTNSGDLIDRFIGNTATKVLRPDQAPVNDKDVSANSLKEDDEFLTETLARIYVQQGYFLKAIQAFEKLSLKIPEKSVYFASQIEMVRELIKNQ